MCCIGLLCYCRFVCFSIGLLLDAMSVLYHRFCCLLFLLFVRCCCLMCCCLPSQIGMRVLPVLEASV